MPQNLKTEQGMSPAWRELALKLRAGLEALGIDVEPCLPGEDNNCGGDYAHHALSYGAAIEAFGRETLRHIHHGEPAIAHTASELVTHWSKLFASQGEHCDHCVKPPVPQSGPAGGEGAES